jgi:hypothetical protein
LGNRKDAPRHAITGCTALPAAPDQGWDDIVSSIDFQPRDRWNLENMLAFYSTGVDQPLTLDCLLQKWNLFVDQLQHAEHLAQSQYEGDLRVRGILAEMEECLSADGRQKLLRAMADADRQFLALTSPSRNGRPHAWWKRVPYGWVPQQQAGRRRMRSPVI